MNFFRRLFGLAKTKSTSDFEVGDGLCYTNIMMILNALSDADSPLSRASRSSPGLAPEMFFLASFLAEEAVQRIYGQTPVRERIWKAYVGHMVGKPLFKHGDGFAEAHAGLVAQGFIGPETFQSDYSNRKREYVRGWETTTKRKDLPPMERIGTEPEFGLAVVAFQNVFGPATTDDSWDPHLFLFMTTLLASYFKASLDFLRSFEERIG